MMRIAMIASEKLPVPPVRGGAVQTYIAAVASRIARRHDVTVIGVPDKSLPDEEHRDGVRYVRVNCTPNDRESYLRALVDRLSRESFDVCEIFNRPMNILPVHRAVPNSRLVLSLHNEMFRETKIPAELAEPSINLLDKIVTVSRYIAEHVRVRYPRAEKKLTPLYSGVSLERFAPKGSQEADALAKEARRELEMNDGPVILYVGRFSKGKGPDLLLDAMPEVISHFPRAKLVMVGSRWFGANDSNEYVEMLWQKSKAIKEHVHFTGYVPYDEVHQYFALADVFVCPSQWSEPLARVHYEAMASGLPIITTDRGGNAEVVQAGLNGIVLQEWDQPSSFALAIIGLFSNSMKAKKMGEAGRKLVEARFTWDRVANDLESLLVEVGKNKGSARPVSRVEFDRGVLLMPGDDPVTMYEGGLYAETLRKLRARTLTVLELIGAVQPPAKDNRGKARERAAEVEKERSDSKATPEKAGAQRKNFLTRGIRSLWKK